MIPLLQTYVILLQLVLLVFESCTSCDDSTASNVCHPSSANINII